MKTYTKIFLFLLTSLFNLNSQTNFNLSNPFCLELMKGNYPADTFAIRPVQSDHQLTSYLVSQVNADSLQFYLTNIVSFNNRNTVNDDIQKPEEGIRGARNWIHRYLKYWSVQSSGNVFSSEFDFDYTMCNRLRHTQLFAVIPGNGPLRNELVILEAHLDSRCEDPCDIQCIAEGADDNGSGSALLMELTRVLSKVQLNRTLVIIWITGEEQGLGGSRSFASYCKQNALKIKAVFNNDIVGGIECGVTSSPPSCPGPYLYDSIRLRVFSAGMTNSMPKNLARMTRILIEENLTKVHPSAPKIDVMFGEDRTGRGSDHIPFREQGYPAIRFTSSYEHGDGNPNQPGYMDRQHSTRDVLGKDIDGDGVLDSMYVNFNYLRNNALVNGLSACNAASTELDPFTLKIIPLSLALNIQIENPQNAVKYIFGLRRITSSYFDTLIISDQAEITINGLLPTQYMITACGVDSSSWISMFGQEYTVRVLTSTHNIAQEEKIELMQNYPNPFDDLTLIPIIVHDMSKVRSAVLLVQTEDGRIVKSIPVQLKEGVNEVLYDYGWHNFECGNFYYSLIINDIPLPGKKMLKLNW